MSGALLDTAQICLNRHVVNAWVKRNPAQNHAHCLKCGTATITACPACGTTILGGEALGMTGDNIPGYCGHCGGAMPWTETALHNAEELLDVIDELSDGEKRELKACLPDLINDSPRTPVAALKTGRAFKKVEPHFREAFKQILFSMVAAKAQALLKPYGF